MKSPKNKDLKLMDNTKGKLPDSHSRTMSSENAVFPCFSIDFDGDHELHTPH
jgi:hypothetical protein